MRYVMTLCLGVLLVAGCSKPAANDAAAGSASAGGAAPATTTASAAPPGSACDRKLITPADLAPIMGGTPTMGPLPGDPQSCKFDGGGYNVIVSLRPGVGDMTVKLVLSGGENVQATPLPGVGDSAAWTSILKEVNATKNNVLCDINTNGASNATPQQVGALCNKIFAGL